MKKRTIKLDLHATTNDLPKHINDLKFLIAEDYDFNPQTETFEKNGKYAVDFKGSKRAFIELGKYLISIAEFHEDNQQKEYTFTACDKQFENNIQFILEVQ